MTTLDKKWANNQFRHNRNSAILAIATMHLVKSEQVLSLLDRKAILKPDGIIFNPEPIDRNDKRYEVDLGQVSIDYRDNPERLEETLLEYWKSARRNLIKECFGVTLTYAEENNCFPELQIQPWFQFARIVRNCLSHDFHFRFRKKDLKHLPLTWNEITIDISMHNKDMPNNFLDPYTTWLLYDEMHKFVQAH